jgi:hypothetical protein
MSAHRPDRPGRSGGTPASRRRARRRALTGVDPSPAQPKKISRPKKAPVTTPPREPDAPAPGVAAEEASPETPPAPHQRRPWFQWRGLDSVATYVILFAMLAGVITGLHRLLAAGILVLGLSALAWAVTHRPGRRRTTSGYGVLLDWLMNALPRPVYLVLCVLVTALGLIGVIVG